MTKRSHLRSLLSCLLIITCATGADWTQFRGPGGLGISEETGLPGQWASDENVVWRTALPGPGGSSPVVVGDRVYLTSYSGYGLEQGEGDENYLMRHLVCIDRQSGSILWTKQFEPKLPEHRYQGEGALHGFSSSTPTSDGERLYVFFGKSGVFCFDLDGNQIWQASVGNQTNGWGSACSPILYGDLLIVNASVESGSLVALEKRTGEEVWRAEGMRSSWNTPVLVDVPGGQTELVVSIENALVALAPTSGEELWRAEGIHRYVCPSVVSHEAVVFAIGGGHTSLAVRAGGRGDVTKTHVVWRQNKGSNVSSPLYHDGYLYWASDSRGIVYCQNAATGEIVYEQRLSPPSGKIYSSPILVEGKLFYVSQHNGSYVVAAKPEFELLAHNVFEDDDSRANASPVAHQGQLLLRSDRFLYCLGK